MSPRTQIHKAELTQKNTSKHPQATTKAPISTHKMPGFPLLQLPIEVQLKVCKAVDDIETFRNLMAIPEVTLSLHTLLRVVTNRTKFRLRYFRNLDKRIKRIPYRDFTPTGGSSRDENGIIYIVELRHVPGFDMAELQRSLTNRHTFIAITVNPDHAAPRNIIPHGGERLENFFLQYLDVCRCVDSCAVGVFGDGSLSLELQDTEKPMPWPKNVTVGGVRYIRVKCPVREMEEVGVNLPPINYAGEKGPTIMLFGAVVGSKDEHTKAMIYRYSKLINCSSSTSLSSSSEVQPSFSRESGFAVEGVTMAQLTGHSSFSSCHMFKNIHIKGVPQPIDENFDGINCAYLDMRLVPQNTKNGELPAVVENVIAPGVQRVEFNVSKMFPVFKNLYFPDVHYLTFRGDFDSDDALQLGDMDEEQIMSLSNVVRSAYSLEVDAFTSTMLGKLFSKALDKLKILILFDRPSTRGIKGDPLVLENGKIELSSLKELIWISEGSHSQSTLDFTQLSTNFKFPIRLKELNFRTDSTKVSLKSIAAQMPLISTLVIRKASKLGDPIEEVTPRILPSTPSAVFKNLHSLDIKHGHYGNMFGGVSFPVLKKLTMIPNLSLFEDHKFSADMPMLETLDFTESEVQFIMSRVDPSLYLVIYNFPRLKKLLVTADIPAINLVSCLNLEVISIPNRSLRSITSSMALNKLKELSYQSMNGAKLHTFNTGPGTRVNITNIGGGYGYGAGMFGNGFDSDGDDVNMW